MKKPLLLYIVGGPAAGKTTLMRALTRPYSRTPMAEPLPHDQLKLMGKVVGCELGVQRDAFGGTDALAMNIAPTARAMMAARPYPVVLGEGNRLGNASFLGACRSLGYVVVLAVLDGPDSLYESRWRARTQNEKWAKGARTQARRLTTLPGIKVISLSMVATPLANQRELSSFLP